VRVRVVVADVVVDEHQQNLVGSLFERRKNFLRLVQLVPGPGVRHAALQNATVARSLQLRGKFVFVRCEAPGEAVAGNVNGTLAQLPYGCIETPSVVAPDRVAHTFNTVDAVTIGADIKSATRNRWL